MMHALYCDTESAIHRLRPGAKLLVLPVLGTVLFATTNLAVITAGLAAVLLLYGLAKIPLRTLAGQIRAVAAVLMIFFLVQLWLVGATAATVTALRFLALILAASLVTLTTRVSDMMAALEKGLSVLSFVGVDPAKVGLAISLVIRFLPVVQTVFAEVREAQAARGRDRSLFSLAVPVVVRTLKMADEIAEAIDARS